ncbi:MAG: hypothetical protein HQ588_02515 [Deltaproteobacteria bacterium]|nr:hypothetical protein [Deltaproteobacteria bacterium]
MEAKITYFPEPGKQNTDEVLRLAVIRAEELGIKSILVASTSGNTALKAVEVFKEARIVAVSHFTGMMEPNVQEFTEENRQKVLSAGGAVLTATHLFSGLGRAMRKKFKMYLFEEVAANTLRLFGQGMKVVCEIALMAADAGLVRTDEDIIVIGGTDRGADTAVVLRPVNSEDFFDLKVKEILCKPLF